MTARSALEFVTRLPALVLVGIVRVYQRTLSPALPILTAGACGCRFAPTCSHYAVEAVQVHGAILGSWLAFCRLVKCTPLHPGGLDPVPARKPAAPSCHRVSAA